MVISMAEVGFYRDGWSFPWRKFASIEMDGHFHGGSWLLSRWVVISVAEVGFYRDGWSFPWRKLAYIEMDGQFRGGSWVR